MLEPVDTPFPGHGAISLRDICSNAGLIVLELIIAIAIKHAIYLKDIGVRIRAAEFVARTVKTKDELLADMGSALYRSSGLHSVV